MIEPSRATDEIAMAVGWVAIEAARVELVAALLEAAMLGSPRAVPVLAGQGWANTRAALGALIKERLGETEGGAEGRIDIASLERTSASVTRADQLMTSRADVVHALWEPIEGVGDGTSLTMKRWGKFRKRTWALDDLRQLRTDLQAVHDELHDHFLREVPPGG